MTTTFIQHRGIFMWPAMILSSALPPLMIHLCMLVNQYSKWIWKWSVLKLSSFIMQLKRKNDEKKVFVGEIFSERDAEKSYKWIKTYQKIYFESAIITTYYCANESQCLLNLNGISHFIYIIPYMQYLAWSLKCEFDSPSNNIKPISSSHYHKESLLYQPYCTSL